MIIKSGSVCYRSQFSQCQKCTYFLKDPYECWVHNLIPYRIWEDCVGYKCEYFDSSIKNQNNSHYVHPDYEDRDRFPEKVFGQGKYRFDKDGNKIGINNYIKFKNDDKEINYDNPFVDYGDLK